MDAQLRIERLVAGGDGLAREGDGRVVFVHGGLPGELVSVEPVAEKKDFARARVVEVLEPAAARRVRVSDMDRLARRADRLRARAPLASSEPYAPSPRERVLRRYLEAFGIYSPPRLEPERPKTDGQLAAAQKRLCLERPRPSVVYIWSPPADPSTRPEIKQALLRHMIARVHDHH